MERLQAKLPSTPYKVHAALTRYLLNEAFGMDGCGISLSEIDVEVSVGSDGKIAAHLFETRFGTSDVESYMEALTASNGGDASVTEGWTN